MITDPRAVAVAFVIAVAPLAIVLIAAFVRGYSISVRVSMARKRDDE